MTLVFTDVEGSTRLLERLGTEAYRLALAEHRRVVREACARYRGYEVDYEGDAFFYAFQSAQEAVSAVTEFMAGLEEGPISVRVGIHTGEPALDPPKYVGLDVHVAARVSAAAHGGQVVLTRTARDLLGEHVVLSDLGEHRFKDVGEPIAVFQLGEGRFAPLKTISNTNLPRPASSFIGREIELAGVISHLERGVRLLTLTGPGGTGKTRLGIEAAATVVPSYKAGVFWVGLASLRDPALVIDTVAKTLGAREGLAEHVGEREMLLLLDNLEQVIDCAPELSAVLESCPNLTLLVTSRELLRVRGEVDFPVPPLAEPEAVSLFLERSRLPSTEEIADLCARLDNIPLAVELAASRTRALTASEILERLSDRLDLLSGGRDADPRQQTLRATVDWSHELLSPSEQQLFARLSVFAGGCTLAAAVEVAGADLDTLQSLVEKSLLRFARSDTGGRYWMLETIREFASEKLAKTDPVGALVREHAVWFADFASSRGGSPWSATTGRVDALEADLDNLRQAFAWWTDSGDSSRALGMAVGLFTLWEVRDRMGEGDHWLESALALPPDEPSELRGMAYGARCGLGYHLGRDEAALVALAETGVATMRQAGAASGLAQALTALSWAQRNIDPAAALASGEEALALARSSGSRVDLRGALHNVGELRRDAGAMDSAALLLHEATQLSRELDDTGFVVATVHSLGDLELARGNDDEAWRLYLEAGSLGLGERVPQQVALCVAGLAAVAARRGQDDLARTLWASVEHYERERGARLASYERVRYEEPIGRLADLVEFNQNLSLEQALGLAASRS